LPQLLRAAFRHRKGQLELLFVEGHAAVCELIAHLDFLGVNHS
jgi:hypothetical protein